MKLFFVVVLIIAVYTVDCRDSSDESGNQDSAYGSQQFPDEERSVFAGNVPQDSTSQDVAQQTEKEEEQNGRSRRSSRCKARNACVVMGGFCVTNATLCGGRLVPEGCKGMNCQCCVPGTLEAKIQELENELQSMKHNLTNDNLEINTELHSMKENINNTNSGINLKLNSIRDNQGTLEAKIQNELHSLKHNLTKDNLKINMELHSIKENINNTNSGLNSKLDSIRDFQGPGCPKGFFRAQGSTQCYKFFTDIALPWISAKAKCQTEGLYLAKPTNALYLRKYLVETYGTRMSWIGARGTGSYFRWDRDDQAISNSDSLWWPGNPGSQVTTSYCIRFESHASYLSSHPNQPYDAVSCTSAHYPLCELVMN